MPAHACIMRGHADPLLQVSSLSTEQLLAEEWTKEDARTLLLCFPGGELFLSVLLILTTAAAV